VKVNTQFPVAVHILAVIEIKSDEPLITSDRIARSVNTNPVVIRRILTRLNKAGLAKSEGSRFVLSKPPKEISLRDVYFAVRGKDSVLFETHENPAQRCVIGRNILGALKNPLQSAQRAMEAELSHFTLSDVIRHINKTEKESNHEENL
jgi:DNA-binding IscR family transcriptional regulator